MRYQIGCCQEGQQNEVGHGQMGHSIAIETEEGQRFPMVDFGAIDINIVMF